MKAWQAWLLGLRSQRLFFVTPRSQAFMVVFMKITLVALFILYTRQDLLNSKTFKDDFFLVLDPNLVIQRLNFVFFWENVVVWLESALEAFVWDIFNILPTVMLYFWDKFEFSLHLICWAIQSPELCSILGHRFRELFKIFSKVNFKIFYASPTFLILTLKLGCPYFLWM